MTSSGFSDIMIISEHILYGSYSVSASFILKIHWEIPILQTIFVALCWRWFFQARVLIRGLCFLLLTGGEGSNFVLGDEQFYVDPQMLAMFQQGAVFFNSFNNFATPTTQTSDDTQLRDLIKKQM